MNAKLIVTYDPNHVESSKEEVEKVFKEIKAKPKFLKSEFDGVFAIDVPKPKEIAKKLKALCKKNKKLFARTFHYVPIEKWVKSDIKTMQNAIKPLAKKIKEDEKWKMDLAKRQYNKHDFNELIVKLTDVIDRKNVDLEKPKKIVKVEIVGKDAGISLLEPDELLIVPKM